MYMTVQMEACYCTCTHTHTHTHTHTMYRDHAKLLWQRIPASVKQSNQEIGELWEIGKRLWKREFPAVYELVKNPTWPPHLEPIVSGLVGGLQI